MSAIKPYSPAGFTLKELTELPGPLDFRTLYQRIIEDRDDSMERFLVMNHADLLRHVLVRWPPTHEEPGAPTDRFVLMPKNAEIPCSFEEAAKLYPSISLRLSSNSVT